MLRLQNTGSMFAGVHRFNSDVSSWDVPQVTIAARVFSKVSSLNQDLCSWRKWQAWTGSGDMFQDTACTFPASPELDKDGPFCASTCQNATVVWSTVSGRGARSAALAHRAMRVSPTRVPRTAITQLREDQDANQHTQVARCEAPSTPPAAAETAAAAARALPSPFPSGLSIVAPSAPSSSSPPVLPSAVSSSPSAGEAASTKSPPNIFDADAGLPAASPGPANVPLSQTGVFDCVCRDAEASYIPKPLTNCSSYIQCAGGLMVRELACPESMALNAAVQDCNWKDHVQCESLPSFEDNVACQCKYAIGECSRGLQDLSTETIPTWVVPTWCNRADHLCSTDGNFTGNALFQKHKSSVCKWCIEPACKEGTPQSQACLDFSAHCCGGTDNACNCNAIKQGCKFRNAESCSVSVDACCKGDGACQCDFKKQACSASLATASEDASVP